MKSKVIRRNSEGTGGAACGRTGEPEFAGLWRKRCALINDVRPILKKDKRPFDTIRMI